MVVPDPGMKIRKNIMNDTTDIVRRHVEAVTAMLLGNRILQPGAMIVAGELTGADGPVALGRLATAMGKDIVFLAFGDTADGYRLTDIAIVAMRAGICHVQMGCRLYLPATGAWQYEPTSVRRMAVEVGMVQSRGTIALRAGRAGRRSAHGDP